MSQAPLQVSTASPLSGLDEVLQTNAALKALATMQSATAAPTSFSTSTASSTALLEGEFWLDTGVTPHVVRMYSSTGGFITTFVANAAPNAAFIAANFGVL